MLLLPYSAHNANDEGCRGLCSGPVEVAAWEQLHGEEVEQLVIKSKGVSMSVSISHGLQSMGSVAPVMLSELSP